MAAWPGAAASRSRTNRSLVARGADPRPPRSRRVLRGGRGARGPVAPRPAARGGRRPSGARRRGDGELRRAAVRDPLGDECGRGHAPLPRGGLRPAPPQPLPAVLAGRLVDDRRGRSPRRAHRARRGLPRPRLGADVVLRGATPGGGGAGRGPRRYVPLLLTGRVDGKGRLQGRLRAPQAGRDHGRAPGTGGPIPRSARDPRPAGCRPARGGAAGRRRHRHDRGARVALGRRAARRPPRPGGTAAPRPGPRDRSPRPRARRGADLDLDGGDLRARPRRPGGPPRRAATHGGRGRVLPAPRRALGPDGDGEAPLRRLLAPLALDDAPDADRRARAHRRPGLRAPRPRPPRPPGCAPARRASASRASRPCGS